MRNYALVTLLAFCAKHLWDTDSAPLTVSSAPPEVPLEVASEPQSVTQPEAAHDPLPHKDRMRLLTGQLDRLAWLLHLLALFMTVRHLRLWAASRRPASEESIDPGIDFVTMEAASQTLPASEDASLDALYQQLAFARQERDAIRQRVAGELSEQERLEKKAVVMSCDLEVAREKMVELGKKVRSQEDYNKAQERRVEQLMLENRAMGDRVKRCEVRQQEAEAERVRVCRTVQELQSQVGAIHQRSYELQDIREKIMTCTIELDTERQAASQLQEELASARQRRAHPAQQAGKRESDGARSTPQAHAAHTAQAGPARVLTRAREFEAQQVLAAHSGPPKSAVALELSSSTMGGGIAAHAQVGLARQALVLESCIARSAVVEAADKAVADDTGPPLAPRGGRSQMHEQITQVPTAARAACASEAKVTPCGRHSRIQGTIDVPNVQIREKPDHNSNSFNIGSGSSRNSSGSSSRSCRRSTSPQPQQSSQPQQRQQFLMQWAQLQAQPQELQPKHVQHQQPQPQAILPVPVHSQQQQPQSTPRRKRLARTWESDELHTLKSS